jgi:NADH-quinone oxidoreductase subunit J
MRSDLLWAIVGVVLAATGTYLLLPHRHGALRPRRAHIGGAVAAALGVLELSMFWTRPGPFLESAFFYGFALAAIAGGILMITSRNPVYSALWFAAVVLSTSGLFLLAGAQFLAAGTVIVYAGAIIVTFLFVIMLAQSEGQALYDRSARAPFRATLSCFVLLGALLYALLHARSPEPTGPGVGPEKPRLAPASALAAWRNLQRGTPAVAVLDRAVRPTARLVPPAEVPQEPPPPHVAGLGGTLFTDHLIAVEVAGALLFIALVGAAAIATPRPPVRPGDRPKPGPLEPETLRA